MQFLLLPHKRPYCSPQLLFHLSSHRVDSLLRFGIGLEASVFSGNSLLMLFQAVYLSSFLSSLWSATWTICTAAAFLNSAFILHPCTFMIWEWLCCHERLIFLSVKVWQCPDQTPEGPNLKEPVVTGFGSHSRDCSTGRGGLKDRCLIIWRRRD